MWRHIRLSRFQNKGRIQWNIRQPFRLILFISDSFFRIAIMMNKVIILAIICFAIVNGNLKDDLKDKVTEALNQGGKVKV
jgi:hypothetical protein